MKLPDIALVCVTLVVVFVVALLPLHHRTLVWVFLRDPMSEYQAACVRCWTLMPGTDVKLLDVHAAKELVPEVVFSAGVRPMQTELLKLTLLSRFGGVWVDPHLMPIVPLQAWLPDALAPSGVFSFTPTARWFLAVDRCHHPAIDARIRLLAGGIFESPIDAGLAFPDMNTLGPLKGTPRAVTNPNEHSIDPALGVVYWRNKGIRPRAFVEWCRDWSGRESFVARLESRPAHFYF
tara:strand:- start:813 stop:1517 length:705 start_codon:yes stop_codon:yes gene_type:complete